MRNEFCFHTAAWEISVNKWEPLNQCRYMGAIGSQNGAKISKVRSEVEARVARFGSKILEQD